MLDMVAIPGGKFLMGSPENEEGRSSNESPKHSVTIKPFFMGKFPVTQAQWQAVAAFGKINIDLNPNPSNFKGANRPVEKVSWDDAVEFCARLSKKTGKIYRLPSEAEWEYACRGGTTTPFYFGETITKDLATYGWVFGTADVGKFPANPFGLFDMHGSICEWCEDVYNENYQDAPRDGSAWLTGRNNYKKLLRGGSWHDDAWNCRCAVRDWNAHADRSSHVGFRVVAVAVA